MAALSVPSWLNMQRLAQVKTGQRSTKQVSCCKLPISLKFRLLPNASNVKPIERSRNLSVMALLRQLTRMPVIRAEYLATRMELLTSTIRLVAADTLDIRSGIHEEDGRQY